MILGHYTSYDPTASGQHPREIPIRSSVYLAGVASLRRHKGSLSWELLRLQLPPDALVVRPIYGFWRSCHLMNRVRPHAPSGL